MCRPSLSRYLGPATSVPRRAGEPAASTLPQRGAPACSDRIHELKGSPAIGVSEATGGARRVALDRDTGKPKLGRPAKTGPLSPRWSTKQSNDHDGCSLTAARSATHLGHR